MYFNKLKFYGLILGFSALTSVPDAQAQRIESFDCPGQHGREVRCLNHKGEEVAETICMQYEASIGARPEPLKRCTATCTRVVNDGGDDGGGGGDPLIFNLDGSGVNLTCAEGSGVMFDMDNDGVLDETAWIEPGNAFLVFDENENGIIDAQAEMFGNDKETAYEELKNNHDSNDDNLIDYRDDDWDRLELWEDKNQNGKTQPNEMYTVRDASIHVIDLNYSKSDSENNENQITGVGTYEKESGLISQVVEAVFRFFSG